MITYKTISEHIQTEILPIKKSRFIANAFPIENDTDMINHLALVKCTYPDARHHCWAYTLIQDNKLRFNDDGEPNGSAGRPILSHIQGKDLFNVFVVVTRYFGGTKLGVGGLIRAYGQAAKEALELGDIIEIHPKSTIAIEYQYDETINIEIVFRKYNASILSEAYADLIKQIISLDTSECENFISEVTNITKGKATIKMLD